MRYEDEDLEIIDAFEDMKPISHTKVKENTKIEPPKELKKKESNPKTPKVKSQSKNKILFNSIVFLPIFSFIYLISINSKVLINNRISIFMLDFRFNYYLSGRFSTAILLTRIGTI